MAPPDTDLEILKIMALDAEDLPVLSAHLQDALVRVGDITYLPESRCFALIARRFDWECDGGSPRRRLTGLHFSGVLRCRSRGIDRRRNDLVLNLLAITFKPSDPPAGTAQLVFAGGGSIELELECMEARLKDLGPIWAAKARPDHPLENA